MLSNEVDCLAVHDAVEGVHQGCLKYFCTVAAGPKLSCDADGFTPIDLLKHKSDQSCTAMLEQLISAATGAEIKKVAKHEMDTGEGLLLGCVSSNAEVEICYGCLHALADAGLARYMSDPSWFVRNNLFEARR